MLFGLLIMSNLSEENTDKISKENISKLAILKLMIQRCKVPALNHISNFASVNSDMHLLHWAADLCL